MADSFDEASALALDLDDPLRQYRGEFLLPHADDGRPVAYLCGHSLSLQPRSVKALVVAELDDWARLGVEGHFRGRSPWYPYHEQFREVGARLVGAVPGEVVMMNSLTVNLHLMLATFFRPAGRRTCILIDEPSFPSDRYAVATHLQQRGIDPSSHLVTIGPRPGETWLHEEAVEKLLAERGEGIAVMLFSGVNYLTGQVYDMERLTKAAHAAGCVVGWDLAHAAGNVVLRLHDWNVDFAPWCSYKYLNSGPGAVGGCFVHERHGRNHALSRLAGWWGTDPATRFQMENADFVPQPGAEGWQVSNPPIFAMAPLRASLALFDEVGMVALRNNSEALTGYLLYLLDQLPTGRFELITPREPGQRGCQVSILVHQRPRELMQALEREGVICDFREPNVIRVAPVPLYNSFEDVWRFVQILSQNQ